MRQSTRFSIRLIILLFLTALLLAGRTARAQTPADRLPVLGDSDLTSCRAPDRPAASRIPDVVYRNCGCASNAPPSGQEDDCGEMKKRKEPPLHSGGLLKLSARVAKPRALPLSHREPDS